MQYFNLITFNIHSDATLLAKMAKFVSKKKRTIVAIQEIPTDNEISSIPELNNVDFFSNPNGNLAFIVPRSLNVNKPSLSPKRFPTGLESRTLEISLPLNENDNVYIVNVHGHPFGKKAEKNNGLLFHSIKEKYGCYEKVILLGDFNTNPYEDNMTSSETFLAYRDFIDVVNAVNNVFYNPSWWYLRERKKNKGTFYYGSDVPKWNFYDQILVSRKLVGKRRGRSASRYFESHIKLFHIPDQLGKIKFSPSQKYDEVNHISDHMPVLLTMEM